MTDCSPTPWTMFVYMEDYVIRDAGGEKVCTMADASHDDAELIVRCVNEVAVRCVNEAAGEPAGSVGGSEDTTVLYLRSQEAVNLLRSLNRLIGATTVREDLASVVGGGVLARLVTILEDQLIRSK